MMDSLCMLCYFHTYSTTCYLLSCWPFVSNKCEEKVHYVYFLTIYIKRAYTCKITHTINCQILKILPPDPCIRPPPLATASGSAFVRVRVTAALAEFCSLRELLRWMRWTLDSAGKFCHSPQLAKNTKHNDNQRAARTEHRTRHDDRASSTDESDKFLPRQNDAQCARARRYSDWGSM